MAAGSLDALRNLAGLPVRFRLSLASAFSGDALYALAPLASSTSGADGTIELTCVSGRKMEVLRRIAGLSQILDISIAEPSLDEIYASFLRGKDITS